jgi:hypothetical protein
VGEVVKVLGRGFEDQGFFGDLYWMKMGKGLKLV